MTTSGDSVLGSRVLNRIRRVHAQAWLRLGPAPGHSGQKFAAVVVKLDRIGDFVLALSAIRIVLRHFGEEQCALVIAPAVAELARREFPLATRIVLPVFLRHKRAWPGWWRARALLADISCEHLVCLRHQRWDYDELVLTWIRADQVHALDDPQSAGWVVNRRSLAPKVGVFFREPTVAVGACRELELHRAVLAKVLGTPPVTAELLPRFGAVPVSQQKYAVVMPFSSAAIKDLPVTLLTEAATDVLLPPCEKIVLVGAPDQRVRLEALAGELRAVGRRRIEVVAQPNLEELVALVAGAAWILTADTAAAHIATALDRPTVVLLGGGHFGQFGPWQRSVRQRWLSHPLPCFGCGWRCSYPEPWCLTRITVGEVVAALRDVIAQELGFTAK